MDIVKDSTSIHSALLKRWKELDMNQAFVIKDASERGMIITKSNISAYVKHQKNISQKQIIWLCLRYGVPIQLQVGKAIIVDDLIKYEMPKYNEVESIKTLNKYKHIFE